MLRSATIGKITRRDGAFVAELKSRVHALDQINGRLIARNCDAELGDGRCRFAPGQPAYTGTGSVLAAPTPQNLRVSGLLVRLGLIATAYRTILPVLWRDPSKAERRSPG